MTSLLRGIAALLSFLPFAAAHGANAPEPLGEPGCRIADITPRPQGGTVSWNGACKDGYAEGKGVLEWRIFGKGKRTLEATLVRGEISGEATMHDEDGQYIGSFRHGMPHGSGYFAYAKSGDQYEGGVADGLPEGSGVWRAADGTTYEGQWQEGKRHGRGKAAFTLGGSYDGEWRQGQMHGQGKIVYNGSGRTYTGEFVDGRALGAVPAPTGDFERFGLPSERPATGSRLRDQRAIGFVPINAAWEQLTPTQQARVRDGYPALDDGDEPPYPLKGTRGFYGDVAKLYDKFTDYEGDATVYLKVGADGVPTSVTTYGVAHREFGRYLSMVAMAQRFKPARCAGIPCAMIYPIKFQFHAE